MNKEELKELLRQILQETACPVKAADPTKVTMTEADRLNTGEASGTVYTHDLFSLEESPRLGCGVMEMERTTFPWTLHYDEIDYVLEGTLQILYADHTVTAGPGEVVLIPKGSKISFSAPEKAKFLYFTYPANWQEQK